MIRCVKIGPHITPTPAYVAIFEAEMVSSLPLTTSDMDARMALKYTVSAALRNIACTTRQALWWSPQDRTEEGSTEGVRRRQRAARWTDLQQEKLKRVRVEEQRAVGGGADEQRSDEEWFAPILVHEPAKDGREHELGERTRGREARESRRGQRRIAHDASDHHRARGEGGAEAEDREESRWAEDLERVLGRCRIAALALGSHVCPPPKYQVAPAGRPRSACGSLLAAAPPLRPPIAWPMPICPCTESEPSPPPIDRFGCGGRRDCMYE
eukprot:COSAG01_NODE_433_length_17113_cov_23.009757_15_plen_269_part_00